MPGPCKILWRPGRRKGREGNQSKTNRHVAPEACSQSSPRSAAPQTDPASHMKRNLYLGRNRYRSSPDGIQGEQVALNGEAFYRIANYDRMRPFFMTLVSDADHWMFVSSTGALTAGRGNADLALFP